MLQVRLLLSCRLLVLLLLLLLLLLLQMLLLLVVIGVRELLLVKPSTPMMVGMVATGPV